MINASEIEILFLLLSLRFLFKNFLSFRHFFRLLLWRFSWHFGWWLKTSELSLYQSFVYSSLIDKLLMITSLNDNTFIKDTNDISVLNCRQSVSNNNYSKGTLGN